MCGTEKPFRGRRREAEQKCRSECITNESVGGAAGHSSRRCGPVLELHNYLANILIVQVPLARSKSPEYRIDAPSLWTGSPSTEGNCKGHVARGGSWEDSEAEQHSAAR